MALRGEKDRRRLALDTGGLLLGGVVGGAGPGFVAYLHAAWMQTGAGGSISDWHWVCVGAGLVAGAAAGTLLTDRVIPRASHRLPVPGLVGGLALGYAVNVANLLLSRSIYSNLDPSVLSLGIGVLAFVAAGLGGAYCHPSR